MYLDCVVDVPELKRDSKRSSCLRIGTFLVIEKIYISYDSTNKNCQAGELQMVEFGHPKEDKGLKETGK